MNTDNRANEPTPEQVEAAAKAMHGTRNPWFAAYGDWGAAGFEIKKAFRESARAALVAAQGAARPVNSFDTTAERVKTGANSLHVAPQEPNQNETKSGNNFVSLDPEQVAAQGAEPQAECTETPDGRPCEASKPGHKLHWADGSDDARGNAKLIADARALSKYVSEHIPGSRYKPMIDRLANALEAAPARASSTAPQAESADCDRDRMGICKRCGMGWDARKVLEGDFACPVLPSSGVDEEKLADVRREAAEKALTDMANELSLMDDGGKRGLAGHSKSSASAITHRHAVAVIRARAEAYRREGKEQ